MKKIILLGALVLFLNVSEAKALPVLNIDNGHYYELVERTLINWPNARAESETLTYLGWAGHLVAITSEAEMNWILGIWDPAGYGALDAEYPLYNHWMGGYQAENQSAPNIGWNWVTGEAWGYEYWWSGHPNYWYSGQPNDYRGGDSTYMVEDNEENFLVFGSLGYWNDYGLYVSNTSSQQYLMDGYMVEYEGSGGGESSVVPEPATLSLLGLGLAGVMLRERKTV